MSARVLQMFQILLIATTTIKSGQTEIVLKKCCLQHEIVTLNVHCANINTIPLHSVDNFDPNFNFTFDNHIRRFRCENSDEVQIEFCMTKAEFSKNFNLSELYVRKNDIAFGLTEHNYCVDYVTNGHIIVKMCQFENICDLIPCVNRCCRPGHVWWNEVDMCQKSDFKNTSTANRVHLPTTTDPIYGVRVKNKTCKTHKIVHTGYHFDYLKPAQQNDYNSIKYCSENVQTFTTRFMYVNLCAPVGGTLEQVKIIGTLISFLGILAAIIFYIVVPELLDLHGKLVLSLLISMIFTYISLAFGHNLMFSMEIGIKCKILGYVIYLTALSMFSWSNALCFNIHRLSVIRNRDSSRAEERIWYTRYLTFAVSYPVIMTFILIVLDSAGHVPNCLKPNIGTKVCFFADTSKRLSSYLILFFIPIGIQITLNWIFFALLVKKIIKTIRMLNISRRVLLVGHASKLFIMAKLCLVMGLPWTLELTLFFWQNHTLKIIADLFNTASGFLLFLVFVLTKSTFVKCRKRYDVKKRVKNSIKVMEGTPHTSLTSLLSHGGSNRNTSNSLQARAS